MSEIILLGTGSAWSGPERENTYMLVRGLSTNLMIDCGGGPAQRLARVGVSPADIEHVILTHDHPDHIYGFPMLVLNAWMAGRRAPLQVYGLKESLRAARGLLRAVRTNLFPNFFKIKYHTIQPNSIATLPPVGDFDVSAALGSHFVETIALRVTERSTGRSFAYSADTSPHPNVVQLARDVQLLLHEATMLDHPGEGHSSAIEAGQVAAEASVKELVLVHLPPNVRAEAWKAAAAQHFHGIVHVAKDMDRFSF